MSHATSIDTPFFNYDPLTNTESQDGAGVQIMSIDNLPCELALESSEFFSTALFPHVLNMVQDKFAEDAILARAIITNRDGTLADAHKGLQSVINSSIEVR
jgi:alpha-aminoadipic semialdehyde synthase